DRADRYHHIIRAYFDEALRKRYPRFITSDYILDEGVTYLRYHNGHTAAVLAFTMIRELARDGIIEWLTVDEAIIQRAGEIRVQYTDQNFSFTDCTSFALCEREQIQHAVAVDRHFQTMRLVLLPLGIGG
ncbi:type II toxin-antitoxin system VapC family toxin, partial [Candidatus Poribacteria bacterium]|nr:type II toxin-antitoxin system VapC family toxin [Candidatus Poribacteria bacterium]